MDTIIEVLEQELEEAVEVKSKKSLHRYILLLTENIVKRETYQKEQLEIKNDIKTLTELMKQGFEQMEKRFESLQHQMDKRFEDMYHYMDKRFEDLNKRIGFMSWFVPSIITLVVVILKFV